MTLSWFVRQTFTCKASFCIKNLSAFLNFIPPPTIKIDEYIFFFISSDGQASILFKMAWSIGIKSDLSLSSVSLLAVPPRLTMSSLITSNSSSIFWEVSGSQPWIEMSPTDVSPAYNFKTKSIIFLKNPSILSNFQDQKFIILWILCHLKLKFIKIR